MALKIGAKFIITNRELCCVNFQDCRSCGKYKYIEYDELCPSCFEEWVVVFRTPQTTTPDDILHDGLLEREAKDKAKESRRLVARPENSV